MASGQDSYYSKRSRSPKYRACRSPPHRGRENSRESRNCRVTDKYASRGRSRDRGIRTSTLRRGDEDERIKDERMIVRSGYCTNTRSRSFDQPSPGAWGRRPRALFIIGLPGAGKTSVKQKKLREMPGAVDIEPDMIKKQHRKFRANMSDDTDDEVHRWSTRRSIDVLEDTVESRNRPDLIFDSSGSNSSWLSMRIETAKGQGYRIELLWVDVPVEIAILRNRDRAALSRRGQWCPEHVIQDKAKKMARSFETLRTWADSVERLRNWDPNSGELEKAKTDLWVYPAPRTRAPSLRPCHEGYGDPPEGACPPSRRPGSIRTMRVGPWKRNDEVMRAKTARLAWMDRTYNGDRERYVLERVLRGKDIVMEPNRFPYHMPPDCEHWTIWAHNEMSHDRIVDFIEDWIKERWPDEYVTWNYDDNLGAKTISIWHIHIYFCRGRGHEAHPHIPKEKAPCRSPSSACSV
eukprot:gnl/MRDRNA2_/MRDRNA2_105480_c0_seq1.p1 gnl/MRDRNA2_/MRDRNA2_105480_c0~~gnl/MRDRNA2_/MRDRNA2_105480_c0_seq1.p1  ORF type:complete len:496 (-),score=48.02 gnl/MRDRNA2_/MRDRNA2_105480_c0_seq1:4-1392(-)